EQCGGGEGATVVAPVVVDGSEVAQQTNLTHIFMIMRDKAIQRRNMYKRVEAYSDQDSLVNSEELENGLSGISDGHLPDWVGMVEEVQYNIITLKEKTKRVAALQSNLVRRPSLDDNTEEERQLTAHNNEIRRTLERCQMLMIQIKHSGGGQGREETLNKNVVRSLGFALQEYNRDEAEYYLVTPGIPFIAVVQEFKLKEICTVCIIMSVLAWTQDQLMFLADNTTQVQERDRAVQHILQSTVQLNQLFRDVAHLVSEQGTILDRIDFNVEHAAIKVEDGAKQLKKAEHYQHKNRNMKCILGLGGSIVFLIILLIIVKS
ncbi:Syntaxin-16-like, partial [Homarus americanus]